MHNGASSQKLLILSLMLGTLLGVGPVYVDPVWSDGGEGNGEAQDEIAEKVEMAQSVKVTIDQAVQAATAEVPGTVIEAELEEVPRVTWEVEIVTAEGKVMEVLVDKDTGAIVSIEEEKPENGNAKPGKAEQEQPSKTPPEPGQGMTHGPGGMGMPGCC